MNLRYLTINKTRHELYFIFELPDTKPNIFYYKTRSQPYVKHISFASIRKTNYNELR